ncbi:hypothetical protein FSY59_27185 [Comamonas sp. Z3]|uniref:hypothetical protein n=1 Tax=Comamonas sp. Z3 TaxID=2601247 RepID=UPI0011E6B826|nr:hypothetical protein [Comamonas sp. Z3]TYK67492.1 hypothetical protein FSY59_27185 [Comamonas sp. Z3]
MILEQEGKKTVENPTVNQIKKAISSLRSYGPSSFASITNSKGKYLQVAGGGITCMLELYDPEVKQRFRAFGDKKNPVFPDGTLLVFGAGKLTMQSDEWFFADKIAEAFCNFSKEEPLPTDIKWRPAPGF